MSVDRARKMAPNNPSWQGWVTEFEVLNLAEYQNDMIFRNDENKRIVWETLPGYTKVGRFNDVSDFQNHFLKTHWLIPNKWNQACFDAIYRESEDRACFVQITIAESHSYTLAKLVPFIVAMNVHVVDFVFVCQTSNFDAFKWLEVNKRSTDYKNVKRAISFIYDNKCHDIANSHRIVPKVDVNIIKLCYQIKNSYLHMK